MPYLLSLPTSMPANQQCAVKGFEPLMEPKAGSPEILLMTGYHTLDKPEKAGQLTDEMRSNMPHTVFLDRVPREGVPDIGNLVFCPMFSERVKNKLEELEPGVHEFFPVNAKHIKSGKEYGIYYLAFINQRPDIIDHDRTIYSSEKKTGGEYASTRRFGFSEIKEKKPGVIYGSPLINFKEPGYKGRHLWRGTAGKEWMLSSTVEVEGPHFGKTLYREPMLTKFFCSDEFGDWIKSEKIRGSKPIKIIEKPPEWYYEEREKGKLH